MPASRKACPAGYAHLIRAGRCEFLSRLSKPRKCENREQGYFKDKTATRCRTVFGSPPKNHGAAPRDTAVSRVTTLRPHQLTRKQKTVDSRQKKTRVLGDDLSVRVADV